VRNEPIRARRAAVEAARLRTLEQLNGMRAEILDAVHAEAERLGFPGYTACCRQLSGIDLPALHELVRPSLPRTDDA
jgi:hypothetical protein